MSFSSSSSVSSTLTNNSHSTITIHSRRRPRVPSLFLVFGEPLISPSDGLSPPFPLSAGSTPDQQQELPPHYKWNQTSPRPRSSSGSPTPSLTSDSDEMPSLPSTMPPTPSPSIASPHQRSSLIKLQSVVPNSVNGLYDIPSPTAGPYKNIFRPNTSTHSAKDLPPTPPTNLDDNPTLEGQTQVPVSSINFVESGPPPPRPTRSRRPASIYPHSTEESVYQPQRKFTDPLPRSFYPTLEEDSPNPQRLDVDLDSYSTTEYDGEESNGREPTLSFLTSSTIDSTASTPSISGSYGFKPVTPDGKPTDEPRIRVRSTTGRANAYSSAESSTASGAFYGYDNHVYHPHPPPLPVGPLTYSGPDQVGLGISTASPELDSSSASALSPTNSFSYRPWRHNVVNRLGSDSAASSIVSSETSDTALSDSSDHAHAYPYGSYNYSSRLPWDAESGPSEPAAVALVETGNEKMLDMHKLEAMGGVDALTEDVIGSLAVVLAPTLVVLDLSNNDLSFLPEYLQHCTSLEELNLSDNPLRLLPNWIGDLVALRVLQVDGCLLQNMPSEIGSLSNLHTICARRNRLVALPSWLCLLGHLETLRVDENPFAHDWSIIVAPILASSQMSRAPALNGTPSNRVDSQSINSMSSSTTLSSIHSKEVAPTASTELFSPDHPWTVSASSLVNQSTQQLSVLDPIAEDHPHSAPIQTSQVDESMPNSANSVSGESTLIPKGRIRRMQSAGALLGISPSSVPIPPVSTTEPLLSGLGAIQPTRGEQTSSILLPPRTNRFASLGSGEGRRAASAMGNYTDDEDEGHHSVSQGMTASVSRSSQSSKWGFLRKMSMSRLKSTDKSGSLSSSASANLKSMPPPLIHTNSEPAPIQPSRPGMAFGAKSAFTLPTRKALGGSFESSEFGGQAPKVQATTLGSIGSLPATGSTSVRGKRRSFLPIDSGPPLINIKIPSVSPFMPTTEIFETREYHPAVANRRDTGVEKFEMLVESPTQLVISTDPETRYAAGLESIKSYLRDLYDLSRSPIEPYGGFEVVGGNGSAEGYAASSGTSERAGSPLPSMIGRGSVSDTRRARRPTLEGAQSRVASTASGVDSERGSAEAGNGETSGGKRFKDDKGKRARVIREIYETERTYVRGLNELVSIYVKPAAQPVNPGKSNTESVVPVAERKIVFGGVESILTIHRDNFLPALEKAVKALLDGANDEEGHLSTRAAHDVGDVFRTYIAYMKQYSTYINNFDNALSRMKTWTMSTTPHSMPSTPIYGIKPISPGLPSIASAAISAGMSAMVLPMADAPHTGSPMSTSQRKRVKTFLKRCREHPRHSQINLESYLLLPVQRIPRYKLLLEDLAMCTPPQVSGPTDTLDDALGEISTLAATMNEEKRDAESRLRLFHWQQRISSRGPSPLVQPHRKLVLDGAMTLIRLVKKASNFVEVDAGSTAVIGNNLDPEHTIGPTSTKAVVQVEILAPEPMDRPMMLILCSDLLVLVQQRGEGWEGTVDLFNVLRMATIREPASIINGVVLRVVDNKSIYYFNGGSNSNTLRWCRAINQQSRR